ncbi:Peroxisomal membrane protein PEX28 [Wickerhamiella sorbophila]|uniref:Peroxisomal membrane protein PEX28 n=1 Tax=Wickerhamiella sorbophila TaxID=45607 RepID=A0A2T0FCH1_9ASCO|nr:Peroxisomal membrane protein PEX28 [Wickerhamiella sorbophila]PRT52667.1 Peroxisomal membrane protein PEX28 [Wickerhamiella sorbophila]
MPVQIANPARAADSAVLAGAAVQVGSGDGNGHFTDLVIDGVLRVAASKLVRKEMEKIPDLSFPAIVRSLSILGGRFKAASALQAYPARFFSWTSPAFTLSILLVYTYICFHPALIACLPSMSLLLFVFIPNYIKHFPLDIPEFPVQVNAFGSGVSVSANPDSVEEQAEVVEQAKIKRDRDILLAIRQGQNSLQNLVASVDKLDAFLAGPANFVDIQESCTLFLLVLCAFLGTAAAAGLVSLPVLFSSMGWGAAILAHPEVKRKIEDLKKVEMTLFKNSTALPKLMAALKPQFNVDEEAPIVREVEIFEVQRQGLTDKLWDFCCYTQSIYSVDSPLRLSSQAPEGTRVLDDVEAPKYWLFNEEYPWILDYDAEYWTQDRHIANVTADGPWAYDVGVNGTPGEYRRRRWTRQAFYSP